jgi:hypothetical protein
MNFGAALPDNDIPGGDLLSAESFHTPPLGV